MDRFKSAHERTARLAAPLRTAVHEGLIDSLVAGIALVNPGFLTRDSIKMCLSPARVEVTPLRDSDYSLDVIDSGQAPPDWVATLTAAGMPVTPATWKAEVSDRRDARVHMIYYRGLIVATAMVRPIVGYASSVHLEWVAVHPEHQGRQLGRAVVTAAIRGASDSGYSSVFLLTNDERVPAISLYAGLGFKACLNSWDRSQHLRWRRIARRISDNLQ